MRLKMAICLLFVFYVFMASAQENISIMGFGEVPFVKNENNFSLDLKEYGKFDFVGTIQPLSLSTEASIDQLTKFPGYKTMSNLSLDSIKLEISAEGLSIAAKADTRKQLGTLFDALKISAPTIEIETKIGKGTFELEGELAFPEPIEMIHIDNPGTVFKYSSLKLATSAEAGSLNLKVTTGLIIKPSNVDPDLATSFTLGYNLITQEITGSGAYSSQWIDPFGINTYVKENSIILNGGALEIGWVVGTPTPSKIGIAITDATFFGNEFTTYLTVAPAEKQIGLYASRVDRMSANDMFKILREGFGLNVPNIFPDCYSMTNSVIQFAPTDIEVDTFKMVKGFELSGTAEVCDLFNGPFEYSFDMENAFKMHVDFQVDAKKFIMNEARKVDALAGLVEEIFKDFEIEHLYVDMNGSLGDLNLDGETEIKLRFRNQTYTYHFAATLDANQIAKELFEKLKNEFPGVFNSIEAIGKEIKRIAGPAVTASIGKAKEGFNTAKNLSVTYNDHKGHSHEHCRDHCSPDWARRMTEPMLASSNEALYDFYNKLILQVQKLVGSNPGETATLRSKYIKDEWNKITESIDSNWEEVFFNEKYKGFSLQQSRVEEYGRIYRAKANEYYLTHMQLREQLWTNFMTQGIGIQRIQSRWKTDQYIHQEQANVGSSTIEPGWASALWEFEPVLGTEYVKIKNVYKNTYLNVEHGHLEAGTIEPGWHSAQWKLVPVPGSKTVRIQNRWKGTFLNIESGALSCDPMGEGAWSAMWDLQPVLNNKAWNTKGDKTWKPGETVAQSTNGMYTFVFQGDGNLVLYRKGNEVKWASGTYNKGANKLVFQKDGNLVIYKGESILWRSNSSNRGGEALSLENSGEVVIHAPGAKVIWSTVTERAWSNHGDVTWIPGETVLRSGNGRFKLVFGLDGNLIIYQDNTNVLWANNWHHRGGTKLAFQKDGNFCELNRPGRDIWSTGSYGKGGETLYLQNDGNLVIHASGAVALWYSGKATDPIKYNSPVRLKNRHTSGAIHIEQGPVKSGTIGTGAASAQWIIEDAGNGQVRIKNSWKGTYLNIEHGNLQCTEIDPNWASAKWIFEVVDDKYVRVKNAWKNTYIHHEKANIECNVAQPGWLSAQWEINYMD